MPHVREPNYKSVILSCRCALVYSVVALTSNAWSEEPSQNVVIQWNQAALQGVRDSKLGPPYGLSSFGHRAYLHI